MRCTRVEKPFLFAVFRFRGARPPGGFPPETWRRVSGFTNFHLVESGQEPYASPRNSAAGAVRQLDSRVTASRKLDLLVYDVLAADGVSFESDAQGVEAIRQWGFKVPERITVAGAVEEIIEYHASKGDADQYANTLVAITVGDSASARHIRIQNRVSSTQYPDHR